jgi:hypothetical protein
MKKIVLSAVLGSFIFIGCNDKENESKDDETAMNNYEQSTDQEDWEYNDNDVSNAADLDMKNGRKSREAKRRDGLMDDSPSNGSQKDSDINEEKLGMNQVNKKEVSYTFTRAESDEIASEFESNVEAGLKNEIRIKGYPTYTIMRGYMIDLSKSNANNEEAAENSLRKAYTEFKRTVPAYLQRNDVIDAMAKVEHRLDVYERERNLPDATQERNRNNIQDVQRAFDDMEREIAEARQQFKDNREDALEEFMEEINDKDPGVSRMQRYKDALEEYNEEIEN